MFTVCANKRLPGKALNLFGVSKYDKRYEELHTDFRKFEDRQIAEFLRDPEMYSSETPFERFSIRVRRWFNSLRGA